MNSSGDVAVKWFHIPEKKGEKQGKTVKKTSTDKHNREKDKNIHTDKRTRRDKSIKKVFFRFHQLRSSIQRSTGINHFFIIYIAY